MNDLKEMDLVADRIQSAVSLALMLIKNRIGANQYGTTGQHNPLASAKRDSKLSSSFGDRPGENPNGLHFRYYSICELSCVLKRFTDSYSKQHV